MWSAGTFRESVVVQQKKSRRNRLYVNSSSNVNPSWRRWVSVPQDLVIDDLFRKSSCSFCRSQYYISIGGLFLKVLSCCVTGEGIANVRLIRNMFCYRNNAERDKAWGIWMLSIIFFVLYFLFNGSISGCWYNDNNDGTDHLILRPNAQIAILGSTTVGKRRARIQPYLNEK